MDGIYSIKLVSPTYRTRMRSMVDALGPAEGMLVLEVGCGTGEYSRLIASYGAEIVSVDIEKESVSRALASGCGRKTHYVLADAQNLPFREDAFDRTFSTEVMEHVEDDEAAAAEMFRVQKPGGIAVIEVPTKTPPFRDPLSTLWSALTGRRVVAIPDRMWGHRRFYTRHTASALALKAGFEIESAGYIINPFMLTLQMYVPEIMTFYAGRPKSRKAAGGRARPSAAKRYALRAAFRISDAACTADSFIGGASHGGVFIKARKPNKSR
jgi:ubiquinone/menaquinone biosynthesis C-methylase UbiE